MSLGRNTVIRPTSIVAPTLQLPFEMLYGQMQQYQQTYDAIGQLDNMMPKHLEKDTEWADRYKQYSSEVSNAVTNAFSEGNTSDAIRMMRSASSALANEWKPGGLAYALEERYGAYTQGIEQLQKAHEKDPTQMNFAFGKNMFEKSIGDLDYDYQTMKYNRVGTPNVYNYVDIAKKLHEEVKTIMPDVEERDILNGMWISRLKDKGYSQDRIDAIWNGIASSPEIQQQFAVEMYGKMGNVSEEDKLKYKQNRLDSSKKQVESEFNRFNKLSVIDKQKHLQRLGLYKGEIDGVAGPLTNSAVEQYKEKFNIGVQELENANPDQLIMEDQIVDPYHKKFMGYFGREHSERLIPNQVALQQQRLSHQKKLQDREFMFRQQLSEQSAREGLYSPTNPVDIAKEFDAQRKNLQEQSKIVNKAASQLLEDPVVKKLYETKEYGTYLLKGVLQAFKDSKNYEDFEKNMFPWHDPSDTTQEKDYIAQLYRDLQENAGDYTRTILDLEEVTDRQKQLTRSETLVYLQAAKNDVKKHYKKYAIKGESEESFVESLMQAAQMTTGELYKSKDPKLKRFYKADDPAFKTGITENIANTIKTELGVSAKKAIEKGQYTPESMPRYSMSGSNKKYGAGLIADRVKQDLQVAGLTGYTDFNSGNRDKFMNLQGTEIDIDKLDPRTVNVEYDSGWGRPSYIITAKDKAGTWQTLRVVPPSTHQQHITKAIEQEFAIGVNDGNLEAAAKAARFYEEQNGNLLDLAGQSIKPTNENIAGRKMLAKINGENITYEKPFTVSYESKYGNSEKDKLQVVTYTDKGQQKWAVAIYDDETKVTGLLGKAEKRNGIITNKVDHQSISDMSFTSYDKALDNALLYKVSSQVPVDQIYSNIPKDLKGIGLGDSVPTYEGGDVYYGDNEENED
jgi:peptidoglycan hydrolase-like protein with peptidoglycan-binding domain